MHTVLFGIHMGSDFLLDRPTITALSGTADWRMNVGGVKKVAPFVYWADCEDPDQSSMCWHKEDALTQINDHGGTLHELSHTSELIAAQSELAAVRRRESLLKEKLADCEKSETALREELAEWKRLVGAVCATIPLAETLKATEAQPSMVQYFKGLHAERDNLRRYLAAAEQRNAELEADKSRIDFWQQNPQYVGGFAPSGDWSFFSREFGTCYGKDLRAALDRLQVMHADLTKPTESGASE